MKHRLWLPLSIVLLAILASCAPTTQSNLEENKLTVLTVEFNSGAPIPGLYLTVTAIESGEEIEAALGSEEGEATFSKLVDGKDYSIAATTLENSTKGNGYTTIEMFTYDKTKPYYKLQTHFARDEQQLDVPVVLQNPELPHGCEITSLTAVLNYYGIHVSKLEMVDTYLPKQAFRTVGGKKYGPNPAQAYAGDPRNLKDGTYVFAAPIVRAAEAVIEYEQQNLRVTNMSAKSKEEILALVKEGVPVVVWVTLDLSPPKMKDGWIFEGETKEREMYRNLHAVVLTGHLTDKVVVMDPLKGYVTYSEEQFFKSYQELGAQAVAIHK
ncbi:MAG: C39 family peptidase [Lysinibacillus sp.]